MNDYRKNPHRIDPNHVLPTAARETNDHTLMEGLQGTLNFVGADATQEQVAYFAEQRALRAMAARGGHNMGFDPVTDEEVARTIVASPEWEQLRSLLVGCYMDGIAIGMRAQQLKDNKSFVPLDGDRRAQ